MLSPSICGNNKLMIEDNFRASNCVSQCRPQTHSPKTTFAEFVKIPLNPCLSPIATTSQNQKTDQTAMDISGID